MDLDLDPKADHPLGLVTLGDIAHQKEILEEQVIVILAVAAVVLVDLVHPHLVPTLVVPVE